MNERYVKWSELLNEVPEGLSEIQMRDHFWKQLVEYQEIKRELFLNEFAEFVFKQGSRAVTPKMINGKPESWQACGRRIWGEKHFNEAFKIVIARHQSTTQSAKSS